MAKAVDLASKVKLQTHRGFHLFKNISFIYFWLCWVFITAHVLLTAAASRAEAYRQALRHGLSCSAVYAIFLDQGSSL